MSVATRQASLVASRHLQNGGGADTRYATRETQALKQRSVRAARQTSRFARHLQGNASCQKAHEARFSEMIGTFGFEMNQVG